MAKNVKSQTVPIRSDYFSEDSSCSCKHEHDTSCSQNSDWSFITESDDFSTEEEEGGGLERIRETNPPCWEVLAAHQVHHSMRRLDTLAERKELHDKLQMFCMATVREIQKRNMY